MGIHQVKQYRILLIGDGCRDVYHFGTCDRLSPEAPVPVFRKQKKDIRPGMVRNVEKTFLNLNQGVTTFCNDELILKERFVDQKTNQHLIRIDEEPIIKAFNPECLYSLKENFDAVVISDYNKGYITNTNSRQIINYAHEKDLPLFVDSKKSDLSLYEGCIIKINEKERKTITSLPQNCNLITTLGKRGARWNNQLFPACPTEVFDVSGAGDSFLCGLVYCFLETGNIEESIKFANKCAAVSVNHFGTYALNTEDIL
jgi:D-beta-D-heptose 7-phosphate kinase/D-beta-D-heptose 1-phosphate adenosyltransferase